MRINNYTTKDYTELGQTYQLVLPLSLEGLVPNDDSVRLLSHELEDLNYTKLSEKAMTMTKDVLTALYQLEGEKVFDFVFMDPPYDQDLERQVLTYLSGSELIYEDTVIIVEASKHTDFSYLEDLGFTLIKEKEYKTNKHVFIEKAGKEMIC